MPPFSGDTSSQDPNWAVMRPFTENPEITGYLWQKRLGYVGKPPVPGPHTVFPIQTAGITSWTRLWETEADGLLL